MNIFPVSVIFYDTIIPVFKVQDVQTHVLNEAGWIFIKLCKDKTGQNNLLPFSPDGQVLKALTVARLLIYITNENLSYKVDVSVKYKGCCQLKNHIFIQTHLSVLLIITGDD